MASKQAARPTSRPSAPLLQQPSPDSAAAADDVQKDDYDVEMAPKGASPPPPPPRPGASQVTKAKAAAALQDVRTKDLSDKTQLYQDLIDDAVDGYNSRAYAVPVGPLAERARLSAAITYLVCGSLELSFLIIIVVLIFATGTIDEFDGVILRVHHDFYNGGIPSITEVGRPGLHWFIVAAIGLVAIVRMLQFWGTQPWACVDKVKHNAFTRLVSTWNRARTNYLRWISYAVLPFIEIVLLQVCNVLDLFTIVTLVTVSFAQRVVMVQVERAVSQPDSMPIAIFGIVMETIICGGVTSTMFVFLFAQSTRPMAVIAAVCIYAVYQATMLALQIVDAVYEYAKMDDSAAIRRLYDYMKASLKSGVVTSSGEFIRVNAKPEQADIVAQAMAKAALAKLGAWTHINGSMPGGPEYIVWDRPQGANQVYKFTWPSTLLLGSVHRSLPWWLVEILHACSLEVVLSSLAVIIFAVSERAPVAV